MLSFELLYSGSNWAVNLRKNDFHFSEYSDFFFSISVDIEKLKNKVWDANRNRWSESVLLVHGKKQAMCKQGTNFELQQFKKRPLGSCQTHCEGNNVLF